MAQDLPVILCNDSAEWRAWLAKHHTDAPGVWVRLYKKGHGQSVTYLEALDEALCFGWIDSQKKRYDEHSSLQKFSPRRAKSLWSKRNIEFIERLTKEGRMTPAGQVQVDAAKADGRWQAAYDKPSEMHMPQDFLDELAKDPKAFEFFKTLNKANTFAIAWRLQTAKKEETRQRRMQVLLAMLHRGEKLH